MKTQQQDFGVEVITPYEFRQVGQVFYPPAMLREALVKRGLVRERGPADALAEQAQVSADKAVLQSPADRMMRPRVNRRG